MDDDSAPSTADEGPRPRYEPPPPGSLTMANRQISQILTEALAFQDTTPHTVVNWREEEVIEREIEDLLSHIEKQNIAESFKKAVKEKIVKAVQKVAKVVAKSRPRTITEDVGDLSAASMLARNDGPRETVVETADKAESLAIILMQKKMINLRKQVELAEQKSRSVTLQW